MTTAAAPARAQAQARTCEGRAMIRAVHRCPDLPALACAALPCPSGAAPSVIPTAERIAAPQPAAGATSGLGRGPSRPAERDGRKAGVRCGSEERLVKLPKQTFSVAGTSGGNAGRSGPSLMCPPAATMSSRKKAIVARAISDE